MSKNDDDRRDLEIFSSTADRAVADDLATLDQVRFVLAWRPQANSPLYIKYIKVDDNDALPANGANDTESPFPIELGAFRVGREITISWQVRAFNDLAGVAAFAKAHRAAEWVPLEKSEALAAGAVWKSSAKFKV